MNIPSGILPQKAYSLRWRLLRMIATPLMVGCLLVALFSVFAIYTEIQETYDANLSQYAHMLLQVVDKDKVGKKFLPDSKNAETQASETAPHGGDIIYRTFQKGERFEVSQNSAALKDVHPPVGFSDQIVRGKPWRFFVLVSDNGNTRIEVSQKFALRHELLFQLLGSLWLPGVLFLAIVFLTIWSGVTRGLRQVVDLSAQVDRRDASDLTPIAPGHVPEEITPLLRALNRLLARMGEGLQREREFTDNAAHELRTPLAAVKAQAQAIVKSGAAPEGMDNLLAGIERSARMVEQMLAFSRLQGAAEEKAPVDIAPVIDDVLTELAPATAARGITVETDMDADCTLAGNDHSLFLMFKNIIDNAVKFSPAGGKVVVRLRKTLSTTILEVQDEGGGIPAEHAQKVFERFYRVDKASTVGSGIGLAIVKWVADAHHARLETINLQPGFCFRVTFPLISA